MKWLAVRNWDKWQSYRQDRGQPPWIKVYRRILVDPDFCLLADVDKCALMSIWIAAADRNGRIPDDENMVKRICGLEHIPDLKKLQDFGWLEKPRRQRDVTVTPPRRHRDVTETDTETDKKNPPKSPLAADAAGGTFFPAEAGKKKNGKRINLDTPEAVATAFHVHFGKPPPAGKDLSECRTLFWKRLKEAAH